MDNLGRNLYQQELPGDYDILKTPCQRWQCDQYVCGQILFGNPRREWLSTLEVFRNPGR